MDSAWTDGLLAGHQSVLTGEKARWHYSKGIFKTLSKNHLTLGEQGTLGQDTPGTL